MAREIQVIDPLTSQPWTLRLVEHGDGYGIEDKVLNTRGPMVEFYDGRQTKFGPRGQFVSRYNVETLRDHVGGLTLDSGSPNWHVSFSVVDAAKQLAEPHRVAARLMIADTTDPDNAEITPSAGELWERFRVAVYRNNDDAFDVLESIIHDVLATVDVAMEDAEIDRDKREGILTVALSYAATHYAYP